MNLRNDATNQCLRNIPFFIDYDPIEMHKTIPT